MFLTNGELVHPLLDSTTLAKTTLPELFTFPFYYTPHPLCVQAANEVQQYIETQTEFDHNFGLNPEREGFSNGKMFGVMVVQDGDELKYLAGFSGKLADQNFLTGFVPPIYDTLAIDGFYKQGEQRLNCYTAQIQSIENSVEFAQAKNNVEHTRIHNENELADLKNQIKIAKKERDTIRKNQKEILGVAEFETLCDELKKQSIYYQFRLKELKEKCAERLQQAQLKADEFQTKIKTLKQERASLSASLQQEIHEQYQFLNAKGERKSLVPIFKDTAIGKPPAGAGECAAPKLFQYAYEHHLAPIAMAEFWWGEPPKSEIRKHKQFYPSCKGKCEPILGFMMQGLQVEPNPMLENGGEGKDIEILFEDEHVLVVNKPAELFSVPGRRVKDSVFTRMAEYLGEFSGPLLVHRLDASTSGIILLAKDLETYKHLQSQFIRRTVSKKYIAILDGDIQPQQGEINLPLINDYNNRPCQMVDFENGKPAKTAYKVIEKKDGKTKVEFQPITGRTHQLRVHSAHHLGLNAPILGDDLYGNRANRLHLHAAQLTFTHPKTREQITINCEAEF